MAIYSILEVNQDIYIAIIWIHMYPNISQAQVRILYIYLPFLSNPIPESKNILSKMYTGSSSDFWVWE